MKCEAGVLNGKKNIKNKLLQKKVFIDTNYEINYPKIKIECKS